MFVLSFVHDRLMNDLGYDQFSNPNWLLKLELMCGGNHLEHPLPILIVSHSLSQSLLTLRANNLIFKDFMSYLSCG